MDVRGLCEGVGCRQSTGTGDARASDGLDLFCYATVGIGFGDRDGINQRIGAVGLITIGGAGCVVGIIVDGPRGSADLYAGRVEDGLGQHGSDASETSGRAGRKRRTGERDHRKRKDVSRSRATNEGKGSADAGRRDSGNRSGRISDARESDVAGRESPDKGRENGAQGVSEEP